MGKSELEKYSKEELINLISEYSKNWLALDGVWFQAIEREDGMDKAMLMDKAAWERYTVVEARRLKKFLNLPEHPGLEGLEKALSLRMYANINNQSIEYVDGKLIYSMHNCRVQTARERKGLPYHPCKEVGELEYSGFAKEIDDRITARCISCYPDITDSTCSCKWEFSI